MNINKNNIDVILIQETKTIDDNFPSLDFKQNQYNVIFNGQKSYNGVAIASKFEINEITRSLPFYDEIIDQDNQARFLHVKINDINAIEDIKFIFGEKDKLARFNEESELIQHVNIDTNVRILEGSGHFPYFEMPDRLALILKDIIN